MNHTNDSSSVACLIRSPLAARVKLNDLRDNRDLARLPQPLTEKDLERDIRYARAVSYIISTGIEP